MLQNDFISDVTVCTGSVCYKIRLVKRKKYFIS